MTRAYLLIQFEPQADLAKMKHALGQPGVDLVDLVAGPYDAVASVNTPSMEALAELAMRVRRCPGVRDSLTCPVLPVPSAPAS
jgi:hypothetical protein